MKVLMVNKFFFIKGGSETYYFSLKKLLEDNGHEVIDFSMKSQKNFNSKFTNFFVEEINYDGKQSIFKKFILASKIIYSFEAKRKLEKLIKENKPDLAHLHIFQHQISLSILDVLKKYNIPIVYTAHDLKMICPNYKMLSNGKICEECKNKKYYNCMKNNCIKNSKVKSFIAVIEAYLNRLRKSYDKIDFIITPSKFYKKKFVEFGVKSEKIEHIPNFLFEEEIEFEKKDTQYNNYYLYFGRLSEEKGIITLLSAVEKNNVSLKIVGTGPLQETIENYVKEHNLENVEVLGFKSGKELYNLIGNAKAIIIPSEWYENGPYSAIETLKMRKPLIGSDLGGIPELIEEGKNGFIFKHNDVQNLSDTILKFENMTVDQQSAMGNYSRKIFMEQYTSNVHYKNIKCIYDKVLNLK